MDILAETKGQEKLLVLSMTTTQIHCLKANTCKKNKVGRDVPSSVKGSGPSAARGTGIPSSITGRLWTTALQRVLAFCVVRFPFTR